MHICKWFEQKFTFQRKIICKWAALSDRSFEEGPAILREVPSKVQLCRSMRGRSPHNVLHRAKVQQKKIWTYFFMLKCYSSTSHTGSTSGDGGVKAFAARKGKDDYNHTQCQGGSQWLQGWFLHGILGFVTTIGLTDSRCRQRNNYRYFFCLTTI